MDEQTLTANEIIGGLNMRIAILRRRCAAGRSPDVIDVRYNSLRINRKPDCCGKYTRALIAFVKQYFEYWQSVYENGNECTIYYLDGRTFAISYEPQE